MARADRLVRQYLRDRFVITTKSGVTWSALLLDVDQTSLLLGDVEQIATDGTATKADGQVFLPRADVAYMQRT